MDYMELIKDRFSCKKFSDKPVEKEKLMAILEAGRVAPTAKNIQPQHVYVMQSPEALAIVDKVTPCRYGAPLVLVMTYDKDVVFKYPGEKYDSGSEDVSIAATHMLLAAAHLEVDTCWLNYFDPEKVAAEMKLPENEVVVLMLDVGYIAPGMKPTPTHLKRKELSELVTYL